MTDVEVPDGAIVPTDKQREFLEASEDELLWGGAAGSGKSFILRVASLGLNEPGGPAVSASHYRAVVIRKSYPDLLDYRDRCLELYPQLLPGTIWKETESTFVFPSGAKLILRHLKDESDVHWFQGQELQFIGWDELTHQPSDYGYEFLKSRLRSRYDGSSALKTYIRATSNPGGPGHEWVKSYWRIPDEGTATCFPVDVEVPTVDGGTYTVQQWRRFIPARVFDNPHVDPKYVVQLAGLRDDLRKALLDGRWDIIDSKGVIYGVQMMQAQKDQRICKVPIRPDVPTNTFWDMGRDTTSVWFHQHVDGWDHFVDYLSFEQTPLVDVVRALKNKDYLYGIHFLPHDAEHKNIVAGEKTARTIIQQAGLRPTVVVPKIPKISTGLELTRNVFSGCRFDSNRCAEGIKALRNYKFGWDQEKQVYTTQPVHNWASHGADAFRQFAQGYRQPANPTQTGRARSQYTRKRRRTGRNAAMNPGTEHIL